jgi:hypothetical protein
MQIKSTLVAETLNIVGVHQYDRSDESANKAKNRMKSYKNRGQTAIHQRYPHIFNPVAEATNAIFGGGIIRNSKTSLITVSSATDLNFT